MGDLLPFQGAGLQADVSDRAARLLGVLSAGDNNIGNVDVLSLPAAAGTGLSTSAKQDTLIGHVDGLEALVALLATAAKQDTIIGHIDTLEALLAASIPAGDNNIGNVDLASAIPAGANTIGTVRPPESWSQFHSPAAGVQATTTKAAGGAGVRHVCTGIIASIYNASGSDVAPRLNLRDGATGAGTVLGAVDLPADATAPTPAPLMIAGLWIPGTANTAMTLEFSAGTGSVTQQVWLIGASINP